MFMNYDVYAFSFSHNIILNLYLFDKISLYCYFIHNSFFVPYMSQSIRKYQKYVPMLLGKKNATVRASIITFTFIEFHTIYPCLVLCLVPFHSISSYYSYHLYL